ncbi:MAG: hypothetical protein Q8942_15295, partial [Bacillota bacterium]|nr:hypothetical protein [Bacillota bacterium]
MKGYDELMNCFSKRVFAWLIIFTFMFSISQGVYADESKISVPSSLEHLDANILNTYFAKLIEDKKETIIKSIEDENLTSLTIDGFNFDLSTGRVDLKLKAVYKVQYMSINYNSKLKADVTFKIITAEDYPKMGIYFMEVSGLSISDCPDAIDDILKKSLNKKLANKEIWPDNQQHADYIILKNDTLAEILTKRLTNEVANFHLTSIEKYLSGCKVNLGFKNTQCELFDITTGKISLNSDIFSNINLYTGDVYGSEKAGTLKLNLDLYIDSEDQSWWVKIDNSDIMLNGIDEKMNDFIRSNIQEYLSKKEIWINFADMSIHSLHASKPTPSIIPTPIVRPTPASLETPTCVEQGADSVNNLNREDDPVILTGKDVGALEDIQPGDLVAWRYNNGWKQIPLQVDEKDYVDLMDIYNVNQYIRNLYENLGRKPVKILTYTDPDTFTGGDSDVTVDDNDEIVFMAKDAGQKADTNLSPTGVIADTCVEVKVYDADSADKTAYVYLFKQDGTLDPGAGKKYVKYNFNLLSGDYKTTYKTGGGPNFEDSTIITSNYACQFGDRWINDGMYIFNAKASGVNLLDRYKNLFAPGNPKRSEDTFCNGSAEGFPGEGCFIVNKSGPVRAIRSYMGAN